MFNKVFYASDLTEEFLEDVMKDCQAIDSLKTLKWTDDIKGSKNLRLFKITIEEIPYNE